MQLKMVFSAVARTPLFSYLAAECRLGQKIHFHILTPFPRFTDTQIAFTSNETNCEQQLLSMDKGRHTYLDISGGLRRNWICREIDGTT